MPWLSITEATGDTSHYDFEGYPSNEYGNFYLAFNHHCKEYALFVCELSDVTEQDTEYTAEEIFELADEVHRAIPMCACGISTTLSVPKGKKAQRVWVAVRNENYFAVESRLVGALETEEDETTNTESGPFNVCAGEGFEEEEEVVIDMGGNDDK